MTPAFTLSPVSPSTRVKPVSGAAPPFPPPAAEVPSLKGGTYLSISGALEVRWDSTGAGGTGEMGRVSSALTCSFIEPKLWSIVRIFLT